MFGLKNSKKTELISTTLNKIFFVPSKYKLNFEDCEKDFRENMVKNRFKTENQF